MHRYIARFSVAIPPAGLETWLPSLMRAAAHGPAVQRARTRIIGARVAAIALLLAILTTAWIAVDAVTLATGSFVALACGRVAVSSALVVLALRCPRDGTLRATLVALAALLAILMTFYLFAINVLDRSLAGPDTFVARTTYIFLPFVIVAGMSIFPLTALEAILLAGPVLAAIATLSLVFGATFGAVFDPGVLWLLVLIAGVAIIAGMSQLRFLIELVEQTSRDGLTGAYTRAFGEEFLSVQFEIAKRQDHNLSLVFLDLDQFKAVNDRHGHEAGDAVLKTTASSIRHVIRHQDLLIRWGGEEFVIVLPETDAQGARQMVDRLAAQGLGSRPDGTAQTASIGIAELHHDGATAWNLLAAAADRRMYLSKNAGRNRVTDCGHLISSFTAPPAAEGPIGAVELPVRRD
jgi:diguanylate cyclase (GGDEF)-like protein